MYMYWKKKIKAKMNILWWALVWGGRHAGCGRGREDEAAATWQGRHTWLARTSRLKSSCMLLCYMSSPATSPYQFRHVPLEAGVEMTIRLCCVDFIQLHVSSKAWLLIWSLRRWLDHGQFDKDKGQKRQRFVSVVLDPPIGLAGLVTLSRPGNHPLVNPEWAFLL
jgi:hypothetical protein